MNLRNLKKKLEGIEEKLGLRDDLPKVRVIVTYVDVAPFADGRIPLPPFTDNCVAAALGSVDGPRFLRRTDEGLVEFIERADHDGPWPESDAESRNLFIIVAEGSDCETETVEERARRDSGQ